MELLTELNGLVSKKTPIQQVSISPAYPLVNLLQKKYKVFIVGVHEHELLVEYLEKQEWDHDYILIEGADGRCLNVIQALGLWLHLHDLSTPGLPKLILIGNENFYLPEYANFSIYEQPRRYNTTIRYETVKNWYEVVIEEEKILDGLLLLVVPSEKDIRAYANKLPFPVFKWPDEVPKEGGGVYIIPGELDSRVWFSGVQTVVDLGKEEQKQLNAIGGEETVQVFSDEVRIQSRFDWLGYDREGRHIRLFDQEDTPKNNPLPGERRSIYELVDYFRKLSPNHYETYLSSFVPKKRIQNAVRLLDRLDLRSDLLYLPFPPLGIKLIHNRFQTSLPISGAVFIACMMNRVNNLILQYSLITPLRTPLHTYFSLCKSYYDSSDRSEWLATRPYLNGQVLKEIVNLYEQTMAILSPGNEEGEILFTTSLKASVRDTFQSIERKEGNIYSREKEWMVDFRASSRKFPSTVTAIAWTRYTPYPILYLWC